MPGPDHANFELASTLALRIRAYDRVVLSVPSLASGTTLDPKELAADVPADVSGRHSAHEHLTYLRNAGQIDPAKPLLLLGMRNSLVNLRAPVVLRGKIHALHPESPMSGARPYYGLMLKGGILSVECADLEQGDADDADWLCAGYPVVWDDMSSEALLETMLIEAADHSHVFDIPRGGHPRATTDTRALFERLHTTFVEVVNSDRHTAIDAMCAAIADNPEVLERETSYLHSVIGLRKDGTVININATAKLETIGDICRDQGCTRAICVENSGSVMPSFYPRGLDGVMIPLLRGPNFRPLGRAVLAFQLPAADYSTWSLLEQ